MFFNWCTIYIKGQLLKLIHILEKKKTLIKKNFKYFFIYKFEICFFLLFFFKFNN